ncbi:MAG: FtsQ-type POTRA domain-containing protein [Candidatus Eisenbacteria sp.]|nr:FtsQ-type POTRA domain-containing protein [Candidatus Eisenbacteria bacterium]
MIEHRRIPADAAYAGRRRGGTRRWLIAAGLLAVAGAALATAGRPLLDEVTRIRAVEVEIVGPGSFSPEEIVEILAVPPGIAWSRLDHEALRERLLSWPRIAQVAIDYTWLRRLRVVVTERQPVAMVVGAGGTRCEVAPDGMLLAPVVAAAADLPLVTWEAAEPAPRLAPGEILDLPGAPDLTALLVRLREGYPLLWRGVSEAHLLADGTYELFWSHGPTVIWGRGPLSATRLTAWATVMADLRERGEQDAVVDLRFREQIVVRLPSSGVGAPGLG